MPDASNPELSSIRVKLEDIRDHVEKAAFLQHRLVLLAEEKEQWQLDGEKELLDIVDRVDGWLSSLLLRDLLSRGCIPHVFAFLLFLTYLLHLLLPCLWFAVRWRAGSN